MKRNNVENMKAEEFLQISSLLSDRTRLAIMAFLAASKEPVSFNSLLQKLELSKGNLSTHLRKLEEGGLVDVTKTFVDRKPLSTYRCSDRGRKDVKEYLESVEKLLKNAFPRK